MSLYIPKIIYMCHRTLDDITYYSKNWLKLNPDFEIKLYDDKMCREFLKNFQLDHILKYLTFCKMDQLKLILESMYFIQIWWLLC